MKRLLLFVLCAGCTLRSVDILGDSGSSLMTDGGGSGGTGGSGGSGGSSHDAHMGDGATDGGHGDACSGTAEICNGLDDDCDGVIDNGFDLSSDVNNCGTCNTQCRFANASAMCVGGQCQLGACAFGHGDANHDPSDGCECVETNGGIEVCDGVDNDCNGITDEGFDLQTDNANCGACGHRCNFQNAVGACAAGQCALDHCLPNFYDADGDPSNGCEYGCLVSNGGVEICDGLDNDCNGMIDDSPIDAGARCFPFGTGCTSNGMGGFDCVGACQAGTSTCQGGFLQCIGFVGPSAEICDGLDNDCNGVTDDPFNKASDPLHCGGCNPCNIPNAIASCTAGVCGIAACRPNFHNNDGDLTNGCEYQCQFTGPEICDGIDNNCDGRVDEGFNLQADANNCGSCGHQCAFPHAAGSCQAGVCVRGTCDPGYVDLDGQAGNGCEYQCTITNATEICNGVDDNCNGQVDEGFNLGDDPNNCGSCGHRCQFNHAQTACVAGVCQMGTCDAGFVNLDGQTANGCEYQCTVTNGGVEICDGLDNNCNGQVDEGSPGTGQACNPPLASDPSRWNLGTCHAGTTACSGGQVVCNGFVGPTTEICDGLDNDCNGIPDDPFNKQSDPNNCGSCGHVCQNDFTASSPNASAGCSAGVCIIAACAPGFYNNNGQFADGCEYSCPNGAPGTPEVCDGVDNDCDGSIDGADTHTCTINTDCPQAALGETCLINKCSLHPQTSCTTSAQCPQVAQGETCVASRCSFDIQPVANFCAQLGECTGSHPVCTSGAWVCNYPATVQTTGPNQIIGNETLCDGKDNDCDGCIDESFPQAGHPAGTNCAALAAQSCTDNGIGACQRTGAFACNGTHNGVQCNLTSPVVTPAQETCNGVDDDCDGLVDETTDDAAGTTRCGGVRCLRVIDAMVQVAANLYVYQYEASRPGATGAAQGIKTGRACSTQNVQPWTNITYPQAVAACAAAGKLLCTEAQWETACKSTTGTCKWSFASNCSTSSSTTCNTYEYDTDGSMAGNQDAILPTGSLPMCYSNWGAAGHIFDMTGNVKEWTLARSSGVNPQRGGSDDNILNGSTCTFNFTVANDSFQFPNVGFRCCSTSAP